MEEKHCKWYNDEFCTNGDSPCVADFCPVVEYPELCKYREDDLVKEQKLTDEEIIKALEERKSIIDREFERTGTPTNFMMIPVDAMVIEDTICLIQRLQDEKACLANKVSLYQKMLDEDVKPLIRENQELKEKYVKMLDLNEKTIAKQDAEIEVLKIKVKNEKKWCNIQVKQTEKYTAEKIWGDCIDKIMRGCGDDKEFWVMKILIETFKKYEVGFEVE